MSNTLASAVVQVVAAQNNYTTLQNKIGNSLHDENDLSNNLENLGNNLTKKCKNLLAYRIQLIQQHQAELANK